MKSEILKFGRTFLIIVLVFVVGDFVFGKIMDNMLSELNSCGETGLTHYSYSEATAPIVIVGSSRANHHYVPSIIKDSLGLKTYNAGRDGQSLLYCSCIINTIIDRDTPRLVIWEVLPTDFIKPEYPNALKPYYNHDSLIRASINYCDGVMKSVLMKCNLYRYNTIALKIIPNFVLSNLSSESRELVSDGYLPLPIISHKFQFQASVDSTSTVIDTFLESRFEYIVKKVKSSRTQLFVVVSPTLRPYSQNHISMIDSLCKKYNITFIDNSQLKTIIERPILFKDLTHMNHDGAEEYTRLFIDQIKHNLNDEN